MQIHDVVMRPLPGARSAGRAPPRGKIRIPRPHGCRDLLSAPRIAVPKTKPEAYLQTRVLRGELAHWPLDAGPEFEDRFLEACAAEGVAPLLHHRLRSSPASRGW